MIKLIKSIGFVAFALTMATPAQAVLGQLVDEELMPSGKKCIYDVGNGITKSIMIGKSEACPQTQDF